MEQQREILLMLKMLLMQIFSHVLLLRLVGMFLIFLRGKEFHLTNWLKKINKILGTRIKPEYIDFRKGDILHSYADISKAQKC